MTTILVVIGVVLVVGVWALYVRLGMLFEVLARQTKASQESLKQELAVLWVAVSSDPETRAQRRKEYGLGPLYISDEEDTRYIWPKRTYYQGLKEEQAQLRSKSWYKDAEDRERIAKRRRDLQIEVLVRSASASPEQKAIWDKMEKERLDKLSAQT